MSQTTHTDAVRPATRRAKDTDDPADFRRGDGLVGIGRRPSDCLCGTDAALAGHAGGPCWPCHRDGFRSAAQTDRDA